MLFEFNCSQLKVTADLHFPTVYLPTARLQQNHYAKEEIIIKVKEKAEIRLALIKIPITINCNWKSTMSAKELILVYEGKV